MPEGDQAVGITPRLKWATERVVQVARSEGASAAARKSGSFVVKRAGGVRAHHRIPSRLPSEPLSAEGSGRWPASVTVLATQPGIPQCLRYRVFQKAEMARSLGVPFHVANPADYREARSLVQLSRVLIVYREAWSPDLEQLIAEARRLGQSVIYEADDIVYRRRLLEQNPNLATVPRKLRREVVKGSDGYLRALRLADHVLASTEALAQDMGREVNGMEFVIENGLDSESRALEASLRADPCPIAWPQLPPDAVLISYGSGSRAHDDDLVLVAGALSVIMSRDARVHLLLLGPVRLPDRLAPFRDRVITVPQAPLGEYLRNVVSSQIAIAPLRDLPFNRFKSQVKYLEAGAVGRPLVASPTVYGRYILDGETGFIARSEAEWVHRLESLVESEALRGRIAGAAQEHVGEWSVTRRPKRQFASMLTDLGLEVTRP